MQPAAMFAMSALNNHRRSDRLTALICSGCKDSNDNYQATASVQKLKDKKLKCNACNIEKHSDDFLVTSVAKYKRRQQTVEIN